MDTKSLLIGIISFIAGALLVSIAATTFEKDRLTGGNSDQGHEKSEPMNRSDY